MKFKKKDLCKTLTMIQEMEKEINELKAKKGK